MKKYVLILLFTKDKNKLLMVKRNKNPYKNCWNGIGGKIEDGETEIEAAIRECKEETNIDMKSPKLFITYIYPENNIKNPGTNLSIIYDFVNEEDIKENYEGKYEWKNINFAINFNNRQIAGYSNIAQFIKEIYDLEGIRKFYE